MVNPRTKIIRCVQCQTELSPENPSCPFCPPTAPRTRRFEPAATSALDAVPPTAPLAAHPTASVSTLPGRLAPGTLLLDRYRIVDFLGAGGMGEVYRADDIVLHEPTALKFPYPELIRDDAGLEAFYSEARTARHVQSPHICRVHDVREVGGRPFLSMEMIEGESLHDRLRRSGRLPPELAISVARQLCGGLEALHHGDILHRDLKPANVMLATDGRAKITDFGLAALLEDLANDERALMGTMCYMAPEQLFENQVSRHSDLYSLGLILYEIFTGQVAFDGHTLSEMSRQQTHGPIAPAALNPHLDPATDALILRCLESRPERRPASAREIAETLDTITADTVERHSATEPPRTGSAPRRRALAAPFVSGRRAGGKDFIGRHAELSTLFSRLFQGESTALVGPWGSGKSSLLHRVHELDVQRAYLDTMADRMAFHWLDLHTVASDFRPADFWAECFETLLERPGDPQTVQLVEAAEKAGYRRHRISRVLNHLEDIGWRLVLLLDEFEQLVVHPSFREETAFFALFRSLATNSSLTLILASRMRLAELNAQCVREHGSPFFNFMIEIVLGPFADSLIDDLLGRAGDRFSELDKRRIRRLAAHQPFLLQAASSILYAELTNNGDGDGGGDGENDADENAQWRRAAPRFHTQAAAFFDALGKWNGLDARSRAALLLTALIELAGRGGRHVEGALVDDRDLSRELARLGELGLLEQAEPLTSQHFRWRGEAWRAAPEALLWWVFDIVVQQARDVPGWSTTAPGADLVDPDVFKTLVEAARGAAPDLDTLIHHWLRGASQ